MDLKQNIWLFKLSPSILSHVELSNNLHAREWIRCTGFIYIGSLSVYHLTAKMDPIMQSACFSEIDTLSTSDPWLALIGGIRPSF